MSVYPKRDELLIRLIYVLEFVQNNIHQLDRYAAHWENIDSGSGRLEDKIVSESTLLLMLADRVADPPAELSVLISKLRKTLSCLIRSERNHIIIMRNPQAASIFGTGHSFLTCMGDRDSGWDLLISKALNQGFDETKEKYPYRLLDRIWINRLMGVSQKVGEQEVLKFSIIQSRAHPFYMTSNDAYAYTHTPMYLTDFGRRSLEPLVDINHVIQNVNTSLAWQILVEDFDLLGEFLIDYVLLNQPWNAHAKLAWSVIVAVWDELGFLPGPSFDGNVYVKLDHEQKGAYAFKEMYHTNLVAGMLCAILLVQEKNEDDLLSNGRFAIEQSLLRELDKVVNKALQFCDTESLLSPTPQGDLTFPEGNVSLKNTVNEALKVRRRADGHKSKWPEVFENASLGEQEKIDVLLEGMMVLGIRDYNLAVLVKALNDFMELRLRPSLTFNEALAFLCNQQVSCGAIGAQFVDQQNLLKPQAREVTLLIATCLQKARDYLLGEGLVADITSEPGHYENDTTTRN